MKKKINEGRMVALIVAIALIIDQVIKLAVKMNMRLYESIHITDWFISTSPRIPAWRSVWRSSGSCS